MPNFIDFAVELKKVRRNRGLSQEALADMAGLHRTHVSMLELGKRIPSFLTIEKLAKAFSMQTWEFVKSLQDCYMSSNCNYSIKHPLTSQTTSHSELQQLINESIKLELNVADVYFGFFKKFPEDAGFWWDIAFEEKNHASLLKNDWESFLDTTMFPSEIVCTSLDDLVISNNEVERILRQAGWSPPLDRAAAFNLAINLEESAGEIHYQCAMQETEHSSKNLKFFQMLNKFDKDHANRMRSYMSQNNISTPILSSTPVAKALPEGDPNVIDLAKLVELMGNNQNEICNFASKFINSTQECVDKIEVALKAKDMTTLGALGHQARAPAAMVGAMKLANLFHTLEHSNDVGHAQNIVIQLRPLLERIKEHIDNNLA